MSGLEVDLVLAGGAACVRAPGAWRRRPGARATGRAGCRRGRPRWRATPARGVHGMSMCRTPRWLSASTTAFCTAGVLPTVADSPMPLAPSGLSGDGVSVCATSNVGNSAALGMRVLGERRRERVGVVVVDHLLPERLRDPRRQPTVHLAVDEHRVQDAAAVVDRDVADGLHATGVGVDLDHRDVGAERERRPRLHEVVLGDERAGPRRWPWSRSRPTRPPSRARRRRRRFPSAHHDVLGRGLQQVGGEAAGPLEHRAGRLERGAAAELQRARPAGATAARDERGVGLHEADLLDRDAELARRPVASTRWRGPGRARTCPP